MASAAVMTFAMDFLMPLIGSILSSSTTSGAETGVDGGGGTAVACVGGEGAGQKKKQSVKNYLVNMERVFHFSRAFTYVHVHVPVVNLFFLYMYSTLFESHKISLETMLLPK